MYLNEIPLHLQREMPPLTPTTNYYFITSSEGTVQIFDDIGGKKYFGENWNVLLNNQLDNFHCERLIVTIH